MLTTITLGFVCAVALLIGGAWIFQKVVLEPRELTQRVNNLKALAEQQSTQAQKYMSDLAEKFQAVSNEGMAAQDRLDAVVTAAGRLLDEIESLHGKKAKAIKELPALQVLERVLTVLAKQGESVWLPTNLKN